jgi:hypothetical protein
MATITDEIDLIELIPDVSPCKTCIILTLRSNAHSSHIRKEELPLELVYSDVLGPYLLLEEEPHKATDTRPLSRRQRRRRRVEAAVEVSRLLSRFQGCCRGVMPLSRCPGCCRGVNAAVEVRGRCRSVKAAVEVPTPPSKC